MEEKVSRYGPGTLNEPTSGGEFESTMLRNEQILFKEEISSGEEPTSFLGHKCEIVGAMECYDD